MVQIAKEDVTQVAGAFGFTVPEAEIDDYRALLEKTKATLEAVINSEG